MNSHRRPTDRRALRALIAAAVLACFGMVLGAVSQTSAAWQDDAGYSVDVASGVWSNGPVNPGTPDTSMASIDWTLVTNNPMQVCFTVNVTSQSATPVPWALTMDLAQAPFNGQTAHYQVGDVDRLNYAYLINIAVDARTLTGTITGTGSVATVQAGTAVKFEVCNWRLPPGVQTPSAYTVDVERTGTWDSTQACKTATVTGNGTSQFYFGFTFSIDMSDARAVFGTGGYYDNPTGNLWTLTSSSSGADKFTFVSNTAADISGTQQFVFTDCLKR